MAVVKFDGPQPARDIKLAEGRTVRVKRGKTVKVPESVAKALVTQRYFSRVSTEKKKPAAAPSSRREH